MMTEAIKSFPFQIICLVFVSKQKLDFQQYNYTFFILGMFVTSFQIITHALATIQNNKKILFTQKFKKKKDKIHLLMKTIFFFIYFISTVRPNMINKGIRGYHSCTPYRYHPCFRGSLRRTIFLSVRKSLRKKIQYFSKKI
jgi:hypothetical protein